MLRATLKQIEEQLSAYPMMVRCHRAFIVNLEQVEQIISHTGTTQLVMKNCHDTIPVSRSNMAQIKAAIKDLLLSHTGLYVPTSTCTLVLTAGGIKAIDESCYQLMG